MSAFTPNNYLQLAPGSPKVLLRNPQHASRIFVDDDFRLLPKTSFLFHVSFSINWPALSEATLKLKEFKNEINLMVKTSDIPSFDVSTSTLNQYNRKRVVQYQHKYKPITIKFHNDNMGLMNQVWQAYYQYYYADPSVANNDKSYYKTAMKNGTAITDPYGFLGRVKPFFNYIIIYQMARHEYMSYKLINPLVSSWGGAKLDHAGKDAHDYEMKVDYEAVTYDTGFVKDGKIEGFAYSAVGKGANNTDSVKYDTVSSPLVRTTAYYQTDLSSRDPYASFGASTSISKSVLGKVITDVQDSIAVTPVNSAKIAQLTKADEVSRQSMSDVQTSQIMKATTEANTAAAANKAAAAKAMSGLQTINIPSDNNDTEIPADAVELGDVTYITVQVVEDDVVSTTSELDSTTTTTKKSLVSIVPDPTATSTTSNVVLDTLSGATVAQVIASNKPITTAEQYTAASEIKRLQDKRTQTLAGLAQLETTATQASMKYATLSNLSSTNPAVLQGALNEKNLAEATLSSANSFLMSSNSEIATLTKAFNTKYPGVSLTLTGPSSGELWSVDYETALTLSDLEQQVYISAQQEQLDGALSVHKLYVNGEVNQSASQTKADIASSMINIVKISTNIARVELNQFNKTLINHQQDYNNAVTAQADAEKLLKQAKANSKSSKALIQSLTDDVAKQKTLVSDLKTTVKNDTAKVDKIKQKLKMLQGNPGLIDVTLL